MATNKYSYDQLLNEAKKYNSRIEFRDNAGKFYAYARRLGLLDKVCQHMPRPKTKTITLEDIYNRAFEFTTKSQFAQYGGAAYAKAKRLGIFEEVTAHMGGNITWTDELAKEEARKYSSRTDFMTNSSQAYQYCGRRGIIQEVCAHMSYLHTCWTEEMLSDEAKKYTTRKRFQDGSRNAYRAALNRGLLDGICSHMEYVPNGYDYRLSGNLYMYSFGDFIGFGITNYFPSRHKGHLTSFKKAGVSSKIIAMYCGEGQSILNLETYLKRILPIVDSGVKGFKREAVLNSDLVLLFDSIDTFLTNNPNCGITKESPIED